MGENDIISRRGLAKKHAALDYEVWQWKTRLESQRVTRHVTKNEVQAHALETYKIAGITNFKASDGWYRRWRLRWQKSIFNQAPDVKCQNDAAEVENEVKKTIQNRSKKRKYAEIKLLLTENIKNTGEEKEGTANISQDKAQLDGFCATPDSSSNDYLKKCNLNVEKEASTGLESKIKNIISLETQHSESDLDSLLLSMNFVKVKQVKGSKRFKVDPPNIKQPVKTNSICGIATSTNACGESSAGHCKDIGTIPVDFQKVLVKPCNQSSVILVENEDINQDHTKKTFSLTEEENIWTVVNEGNVSLTDDSPGCSLTESGISIPSSSENLEATDSFVMSPIFQSSEIDFTENEYELFCDSCEDFHPREKCPHLNRKQKNEARNSFLLNCVFEKKDSTPAAANVPIVTCKNMRKVPKSSNDPSISQVKNVSAIAPKGKRYLMQFKSKVVNFALNHSVKLAAEKFKVNRNTVAEWLTERNRFPGDVPGKQVNKDFSGGSEFLAWLEDSKFNLTNELMKQKALEWLQMNEYNNSQKSHWLQLYAQRLCGTEDVAVKKRYIVYPEAFKRAVVFHAQTHSNMAAARVFCVARKRIIEWQQHSSDVKKMSKYVNANNVTDEAVDIQVYEWFCQQKPTPSSQQVRNKALELYRAAGHSSIQCKSQWYYRWRARHNLPPSRKQLYSDMTPLLVWALSQLDNNRCVSQSAIAAQAASLGHKKVSRGWTFRFCKKYSALLQDTPTPGTALPSTLELQVQEYKQKLHDFIASRGVTEDHIIVLDEIPLHFLPRDKAKKPLLVRRPGFETCQASLVISCLADGTLLPTMFVFKGSGPSVSDPRVIALVNDTGRISDDTMQKWLLDVCFLHLEGEGVLVMDSFDVHLTPAVSQSVAAHNINMAITPPGCASRLLPITPFCHTFKMIVEDMCQKWLSSQPAALESPSPDQLYQWAVQAHKRVAKHYKEKIQIAFKNMLRPQSSPDINS